MSETKKEETWGQEAIKHEIAVVQTVLLHKNARYGNSALEPANVFASADAVEQIAIRVDDKIKRIRKLGLRTMPIVDPVSADGDYIDGEEDTLLDLIGYLVLLRAALRMAQR